MIHFKQCAALGLAAMLALTACVPGAAAPVAEPERWLTYTSADAAYAFDYPQDSLIQESDDAAAAYKVVHVQFPVTDTADYQGASVLVLDNPANLSPEAYVAAQTGSAVISPTQSRSVADRPALQLERDAVVGDFDARTTLVPGAGVLYRVNLFGGGKGGDVEPSPQALAYYEHLLATFRVLEQPLQPRAVRGPRTASAESSAIATEFSFPLRDANGVNYGVPVGIVLNNTRMEWLDYAIRNLDQWRIKCYNVDWTRMLHTGEDWYRLDYLTRNTAGTPVYAVADGVVARHSPGLSYPGNVVLIRHRLPEGRDIYSMYGHVANVSVVVGQAVTRGQQIATVFNQGYVGRTPGRHPSWDSHMHFEMRWMEDAGRIYTRGTNAYGYNYPGCNWLYPGRGYTYRISPNDYPYPNAGYVDPSDFIRARLPASAQASDEGLLGPGAESNSYLPAVGSAASPLSTPPQQAQSTCSNLAVNGEFETAGGWAGIANTAGTIYTEAIYSAARARNGSRSGRVGSPTANGYWNEILQTVTIPPNASSATLTVWRYLETGETSRTRAYDIFTIGLETDKGIELVAPRRVDNTSAGRNAWVRETLTLPNPGALANQGVWITIKGNTDRNKPTKLYIDDVALTVCTP